MEQVVRIGEETARSEMENPTEQCGSCCQPLMAALYDVRRCCGSPQTAETTVSTNQKSRPEMQFMSSRSEAGPCASSAPQPCRTTSSA